MLIRDATQALRVSLEASGQTPTRLDPWEAWRSFKAHLTFPPCELRTLDLPTLEEWACVVEGMPSFQEGMARTPTETEVYYDEGPEEEF
jgi:hypothetical protein